MKYYLHGVFLLRVNSVNILKPLGFSLSKGYLLK